MKKSNANGRNWIASAHEPGSNSGKPLDERQGILVIDDSCLFQRMLVDMLESSGYPVIGVASCGNFGADMAQSLKPRLIILDHNMPECNGLQCLNYIRSEDKEVRVIVCSGDLTLEISREYLVLGADDFLTKPISLRALFSLLKHHYDNKAKPKKSSSFGVGFRR